MTFEQMLNAQEDITLLERDLMRDLTSEEKDLVINQGYQALLTKLGFDDEDFKTLRRIETLISAFCTENEERYEEELKKDNHAAKFVLQSILNDLNDLEFEKMTKVSKVGPEEELGCKIHVPDVRGNVSTYDAEKDFDDLCNTVEESPIQTYLKNFGKKEEAEVRDRVTEYVKQLRNGEVLTLDPDTINRIVEKVWNECDDCNIQIVNNKIRMNKLSSGSL